TMKVFYQRFHMAEEEQIKSLYMKTIRRILKIHKIEGFKVFCLFNTGESRIIDFKDIFEKWKIDEEDPEFLLLNDEKAFKKVKLIEGTLVWENIKIQGIDEKGQKVEYPFDMDPIVLYENSILDETRQLELGLLIKKSRTELGLTQEELAKRSGTTKHYISRVENDKTGIELSTLKKIIEGGLGKRMKISII
ncbi:MAG TPA: helix-turn-helix transcriptional regulator, partial [Saprospiraceae bacterium]|nr:helix-turn-helix transcriptional regulator [Saprospiraceae bacterium]